jgi:hypothetical protein
LAERHYLRDALGRFISRVAAIVEAGANPQDFPSREANPDPPPYVPPPEYPSEEYQREFDYEDPNPYEDSGDYGGGGDDYGDGGDDWGGGDDDDWEDPIEPIPGPPLDEWIEYPPGYEDLLVQMEEVGSHNFQAEWDANREHAVELLNEWYNELRNASDIGESIEAYKNFLGFDWLEIDVDREAVEDAYESVPA